MNGHALKLIKKTASRHGWDTSTTGLGDWVVCQKEGVDVYVKNHRFEICISEQGSDEILYGEQNVNVGAPRELAKVLHLLEYGEEIVVEIQDGG